MSKRNDRCVIRWQKATLRYLDHRITQLINKQLDEAEKRCKHCIHWERISRECVLMRTQHNIPLHLAALAHAYSDDGDSAFVITDPDFRCIQFRHKP